MIEQVTVLLQNDPGRLPALCRDFARAEVNVHHLFISDTTDFGIVRIFCDTPRRAAGKLREAGWRAGIAEVLAVRVPNEPGALANLLEAISARGAKVEYGYCLTPNSEIGIDILKVNDPDIESALLAAGFTMVDPADVYVLDAVQEIS